MIITIDGPAGSGKSTLARNLAARLGLSFLDTGAMYRAVTLVALEHDIDPMDADACARLAEQLELSFDAQGRILIDGRPGEPLIRSETVTKAVSPVSAHPAVRRALVRSQRAEAERRGGLVAEGRDMGTVVFPNAAHKFFLTASPRVRAQRRCRELNAPARLAEIQADIELRDHLDSSRKDSPLSCAADAVRIDTDTLNPEQVVEALLAHIRKSARG